MTDQNEKSQGIRDAEYGDAYNAKKAEELANKPLGNGTNEANRAKEETTQDQLDWAKKVGRVTERNNEPSEGRS
jgi:hypothetical protein